MDYQKVIEQARTCIGSYCKACAVCMIGEILEVLEKSGMF